MAYAEVGLSNNLGKYKTAPIGFSWTTLFFGAWPAIFRGDFKWAFIMIISSIFTLGLSCLVFPFLYNKLYIKDRIRSGFRLNKNTPDALQNVVREQAGQNIEIEA